MEKIRILLYKVGKESKVVTINNTLKAQQKAVGGHIEVVGLGDNIYMTVNEEGKLDGKCLPNRRIDYNGFKDVLFGDFFITAVDDEGNNISLTDTEIKYWKDVIDKHTTQAQKSDINWGQICPIKIYTFKKENKDGE